VKFFRREGAANIYTGYRQHNYHCATYGAMFLGQIAPALEAVKGLRDRRLRGITRHRDPRRFIEVTARR
jgi:hypothetical protein